MSDFLRLVKAWDPDSGRVGKPVPFDIGTGHAGVFP
jgi:hypothetical protein